MRNDALKVVTLALCLAAAFSSCAIEDELFVYGVNLTDEAILVYAVASSSGEESSSSGELLSGDEWLVTDGGNDCLRRVYRARNLNGELIEEQNTICRTDPWQIDGVSDN